MKFTGLNLTVPHKLLAVEMVDALDPSVDTLACGLLAGDVDIIVAEI